MAMAMATVLAIDMVDIMAMVPTGLTMADTWEGRREKLRQSQQLLLIPMLMQMLMLGTVAMGMVLAIDMVDIMEDMPTDHTMVDMATGERRKGLLMLSRLLMLMLGMVPMAMAVGTMAIEAMDTGARFSISILCSIPKFTTSSIYC